MVQGRPVGRGALGSGVGSQMRQALLRRSPAQCSIVPRHDPNSTALSVLIDDNYTSPRIDSLILLPKIACCLT
jgi:hypothetical protein